MFSVKHESAIAIIPARFESTRLPGKPILEIQGKTLIEHVYRRVQCAKSVERIVIATDDERIASAVRKFGGEVIMTRFDHQSGTDRLAEAAAHLPPDTLVVNIQGDEPLIEPDVIDRAVAAARHRDAQIVTVMTPLLDPAAIADPNRVKVVVDRNGFALYFSRSPIPYRVASGGTTIPFGGTSGGTTFLHLGLYVYRVEFLREFTRLDRAPLEIAERLEQLRALEHGFRIRVVEVESESWGIDTPADLERFKVVVGNKNPR
jgi:3-deoxy-manno-octulosonate cytidylyltransferase (CMP-KDO synthetase)